MLNVGVYKKNKKWSLLKKNISNHNQFSFD